MVDKKIKSLMSEIACYQNQGDGSWWGLTEEEGVIYEWRQNGEVRGKTKDGKKSVVARGKVSTASQAITKFEEIKKRLEFYR
jgi:hypothetical protein